MRKHPKGQKRLTPRFFRPGRIIRNIARAQRRFIRRRTRRLLLGGAIILALAGTHQAYKFRNDDVQKMESYYRKPAEEMTEEEITQGMRKLNIKKIELDDNDRAKVYNADQQHEGFQTNSQKYCFNCGDIVEKGEIYCSNCGQKL